MSFSHKGRINQGMLNLIASEFDMGVVNLAHFPEHTNSLTQTCILDDQKRGKFEDTYS